MARVCQLTGKKTVSGNNRPFSLKSTKRTFRPNLFVKKMWNPRTGKVERMKLSAKAIRTLKKWAKEAGKLETFEAPATPAPTKNEEKHRVKKEKLTPKQKKELAAAEEAQKTEEAKPEVVKEMEEKKPAKVTAEKKADKKEKKEAKK